MAQLNYVSTTTDLEQEYTLFPSGEYIAVVSDADICENKNKNGEFIKLEYTFGDGPLKGKKAFNYLNIRHPNSEAVNIGQRAANSLYVALGYQPAGLPGCPKDTEDLKNKPFTLVVLVQDDKSQPKDASGNYPKKNSFKHKPLNINTGQQQPNNNSGSIAQQQVQPSSQGAKQPWEL